MLDFMVGIGILRRRHLEQRFGPVFMAVSDARDQDGAVVFYLVDHQVRLHGMDSNRRRQFQSLSGGERIIRKELEGAFQQRVIGVGLVDAKLFSAECIDLFDVCCGLAGQPVGHGQELILLRAEFRKSAMLVSLTPL